MQEQSTISHGLNVQLFGPLQIFSDGAKLEKSRTVHDYWLLALLLLESDAATSDAATNALAGDATSVAARDFLANALWPGNANNGDYLKTSLRLLRQALGPEARRITAPRGKLCLEVSDMTCDWLTFQRCARSDDPEQMRQAVELYRPPLIEGCTDLWVLPYRKRAARLFAAATQKLASLCEADHDVETAAAYIRRAWQENAGDEALLERYMRMLQRMGRYAEINDAFNAYSSDLKQKGDMPSPEIGKLYRMLRSRGSAEARTSATNAPRVPHLMMRGFPTYRDIFVGREPDIQAVISELEVSRVVSIVGAGGIGKTRLCTEAVLCLLEQDPDAFRDGAFFVELGDLTNEDLIARKIASTLNVPQGKAADIEAALGKYLEPKSLLLVLNNCEHLIRSCARLVGRLTAGCQRLHILVTSRRRLGLEFESPLHLAPLASPPIGCAAADLGSYASVQLLLRRTDHAAEGDSDGRSEFSLSRADAASVTRSAASWKEYRSSLNWLRPS